MSNTTWWYVMRAAGLTSWFFLTLTLMWGTIASGRLLPNAKARRWVVDLHPFLGAVGLGALALHIVAAVADTYVGLTWVDTVVPFTAGWHPWGIAAGVVALWMLVVVQVTSLLRRQLGKATWHRIHLVSYAMAWITGLHAVMNGSDLGNRAGGLVRGGSDGGGHRPGALAAALPERAPGGRRPDRRRRRSRGPGGRADVPRP